MIEVNDQELLLRAEKVVEAAERYKQHVFAHEIYKNKVKTFLARLKMEIRSKVEKISEAELETRALATDSWQTFSAQENDALTRAGIEKMNLEAAETRFKAMQSALSSRKAEVRSFG